MMRTEELVARLAAAPFAGAALAAAALAQGTRASDWAPTLDVASAVCPPAILALSLAPLAAFLRIARAGAPTAPARSGAAAGLAAGGIGGLGYAVHCTIDAPGYVLFWYPLGMVLAGLLGALAGRRALAW